MCVGVFKCSDVMVSYVMSSSILINHYKKTSVLYNECVASKHQSKNMFVKPMLAVHRKTHIKLTLAQCWANVSATQNTHCTQEA